MMTPLQLEAVTLRVFHHGEGIAAFGRDELGRLAAHWRAQLVPIAYAVRGWQGGPHLDLNVCDRDPSRLDINGEAQQLRVALRSVSARPIDADAHREQSRRLAEMEGVANPDLELHPHGTVEILSGARDAALPSALQRSSDRVLTALFAATAADGVFATGALDGPARRARVAAIMAELASTHPSGFGFGTMSFRSHAEAFLASTRDPQAIRGSLEGILDAERATLEPVIGAALTGRSPADLLPWRQAFAYAWGCLDGAMDAGTLTLQILDEVRGAAAAPARAAGASGPSEFHRVVGRAGIEDDPQPWFAVYRMLLNSFYRLLPLLDISPRERYYLCLAVAQLGDEALGESWSDRVERVQALRAGVGDVSLQRRADPGH
jgi:hypothetical protein